MAAFFLGILISGVIAGSIAYNCFTKREVIERSLRTNIENLEYNVTVLKKESELKIDLLNADVKKAKEESKKHISHIDTLDRDIKSLRKQLEECKKALADI